MNKRHTYCIVLDMIIIIFIIIIFNTIIKDSSTMIDILKEKFEISCRI